MNDDSAPEYWVEHRLPKPGFQKASDLIEIEPERLKHHAIVFAQSGSGKSFTIGRLIEEIILKTRANCVVFDPNSDYSRSREINYQVWQRPKFERDKGALPTEATAEEFEKEWPKSAITILKGTANVRLKSDLGEVGMRLGINELSPEFIAEDMVGSELIQCEYLQSFISQLCEIISQYCKRNVEDPQVLLSILEQHYNLASKLDRDEYMQFLTTDLVDELRQKTTEYNDTQNIKLRSQMTRIRNRISQAGRKIIKAARSVNEEIAKTYFARLSMLMEKGILKGLNVPSQAAGQLRIVDIPSIDEDVRLLVVDNLLENIWRNAREEWERAVSNPEVEDNRVPTFIFVDEAHNLIPFAGVLGDGPDFDKQGKLVRERFRRVAAEGRKFGLFLVLITQRPDKLDPLTISECENRMVMKIGSKQVLLSAKETLGLTDEQATRVCDEALMFKIGRGMLLGPWAGRDAYAGGRAVKFYTAARRTIEGGRNLNDSYWATKAPLDHEPPSNDSDLGKKIESLLK